MTLDKQILAGRPKNGQGGKRETRMRMPDEDYHVKQVCPKALFAHPLNLKLYGEPSLDQKFLDSVKRDGILQPILVQELRNMEGVGPNPPTTEFTTFIVSGHRRHAAALKLGLKTVPIVESGCLSHPAFWTGLIEYETERTLIESNYQRVKTTAQKLREGRELIRIEKELAKQRQKTLNNAGGKVATSETGKARDKAAAAVGLSGRTLDAGIKVLEAADKGDATAQEQVSKLERGETNINAAVKAIRPPKDPTVVSAQIKKARELTMLFKDAEVTRSAKPQLFHVVLRNLTESQVEDLAKEYGT
jgi:hypothetical protein